MRSKRGNVEYFDLLARIKADHIFVGDSCSRNGRLLAVRHDIDHSIDRALAFAEKEADRGILSTYFLLDTARYWDSSIAFISKCKALQSMGHRVAWHNNALGWHLRTWKPLRECIEEPLDFMRQNGFPAVGSASHGDKILSEYQLVNYDVWKVFDMAEFGLEWEAYFIPKNAYLSDSGGRWQGWMKPELRLNPNFEADPSGPTENAYSIIDRFNTLPHGQMQLLVHPHWWEV